VDGILYSAEIGAKKPERAFFERVVLRMEVAPDEILLIDDAVANINAAAAAGWNTLHWNGDASPRRSLCLALSNELTKS
jgi:putative hydrolase of the HAD superfamily